MSTLRTDPHRPGAIIPSDYHFVLGFGLIPAGDPSLGLLPVRFNVDRALELSKTARFFEHPGGARGIFQCDVCGAHYNHGEVWLHGPTGEHITVGHDCADKYGLLGSRAEWLAWHREQTALRSQAAKDKRFKVAALRFLAGQPELGEALALADEQVGPALGPATGARPRPLTKLEQRQDWRVFTLADLRRKLNRFGSLSERQVAFALKLAAEYREAAAAGEPTEEPHVPAPEGRTKVRGRVVSVKGYDGVWGHQLKMTVKVETPGGSWLCWVTVPREFTAERGAEVEFTATLARGKDEHFAFGKRPTGARVVEQAGANIGAVPLHMVRT